MAPVATILVVLPVSFHSPTRGELMSSAPAGQAKVRTAALVRNAAIARGMIISFRVGQSAGTLLRELGDARARIRALAGDETAARIFNQKVCPPKASPGCHSGRDIGTSRRQLLSVIYTIPRHPTNQLMAYRARAGSGAPRSHSSNRSVGWAKRGRGEFYFAAPMIRACPRWAWPRGHARVGIVPAEQALGPRLAHPTTISIARREDAAAARGSQPSGARSKRKLLHAPPDHRSRRAAGRGCGLGPLELVARDRQVGSLLVAAGPIRECAAFDVKVDVRAADRIGAEIGDTSLHGGLVFGGGS